MSTTHTIHANTLTAGLAADCPRCREIVANGEFTSPGFDDLPGEPGTPEKAAAAQRVMLGKAPHADNTATDEQHDAADAALVSIMTSKITGTEWGHDLIHAAMTECVYSPWFRDITYTGPDDARDGVNLCIEDPHGTGWKRYRADANLIAKAIAEIWNGQHGNGYVAEYIRDAINEHDAGHIDADAADAIIQVATLGEIVYG